MYRYDEFDKKIVFNRVAQFKEQIQRRIKGDLTEEEFKPLRLMNGLYLQLHAYMLRVAIPYGELSHIQLQQLANISDKYDRGYGHFTTRQNIQFNWPKLLDVPLILNELAKVEMHAIQTSGNCIRNITADHFSGLLADEIEDPRPWCEIIRKWSTFHPEFSFLPRKFKIAVIGSRKDRAAMMVHDIGLRIVKINNEIGFEVYVGGGQGRTPILAQKIRSFVKAKNLLSYLEAILKTYNQLGRRDNIYKARIKILVKEIGIDKFKSIVEDRFRKMKDKFATLDQSEIDKIKNYFKPPEISLTKPQTTKYENPDFKNWIESNTLQSKYNSHSIVIVSLKSKLHPPGDIDSRQMRALANISKENSYGQIRVTHEQNLVLPLVNNSSLFRVWNQLKLYNLATPNVELLTDSICCPGMDYCSLATARSIPIAQRINNHFDSFKLQKNIGKLKIKISGCINACGHHHVGNIGILGLEKNGKESYQISLGGSADEKANIGTIVGSSFSSEEIILAIEKIINVYLSNRRNKRQTFLQTFKRIGIEPFKKALYDSP